VAKIVKVQERELDKEELDRLVLGAVQGTQLCNIDHVFDLYVIVSKLGTGVHCSVDEIRDSLKRIITNTRNFVYVIDAESFNRNGGPVFSFRSDLLIDATTPEL